MKSKSCCISIAESLKTKLATSSSVELLTCLFFLYLFIKMQGSGSEADKFAAIGQQKVLLVKLRSSRMLIRKMLWNWQMEDLVSSLNISITDALMNTRSATFKFVTKNVTFVSLIYFWLENWSFLKYGLQVGIVPRLLSFKLGNCGEIVRLESDKSLFKRYLIAFPDILK